MKKVYLFLLTLASLLAFTSCEQKSEAPKATPKAKPATKPSFEELVQRAKKLHKDANSIHPTLLQAMKTDNCVTQKSLSLVHAMLNKAASTYKSAVFENETPYTKNTKTILDKVHREKQKINRMQSIKALRGIHAEQLKGITGKKLEALKEAHKIEKQILQDQDDFILCET